MKKLLLLFLVLVLLPAAALAEVHYIADESQLPEGWTEKELLRLTSIDVQRSDAILVQCGGENMMIDGGSGQYYERLAEYFDAQEITGFKYLFNTHPDNDHLEGLTKIMNHRLTAEDGKTDLGPKYTIGSFCTAVEKTYTKTKYHKAAVRAADKYGVPYQQVYHGDVLTLGGATINVMRCNESWGTNNRSACTQIVFGDSKVLMMGDCAAKAQRYLVKHCDPSLLACDVIKASHHGINFFVEEMLEVAQPEVVFVTNFRSHDSIKSGYRRYYDDKGKLYSGDGTVIMETDGTDWYIWQLPNWAKK